MRLFSLHLVKVLTFTILLGLGADFVLGQWFYRIHKRSRLSITGANYDILFLGSSRCIHNIDPNIIDSAFHVRSFNLGIDASGLPEIYAALCVYLKNNEKPKQVVCQIDFWHPNENADILSRQGFVKYYHKGIIDDYFHSFKDEDYMRLPLYPYIMHRDLGWREWLKACFRNKEVLEEAISTKGFEPLLTDHFNQKLAKYNCDTFSFHTNKFLLKIIELCESKEIKLALFTSPIYKNNCDKYFDLFYIYNIPYLNQADLLIDSSYFQDKDHVNYKGAEVQSRNLAEFLQNRPGFYK